MDKEMKAWLDSQKHLPVFMRDFHDQKDLFKAIHDLYSSNETHREMPNWIQSHMYTIDWFLWYMASRGYTLQKCRAKQDFKPFHKYEPPNLFELINAKQQ